MNTHELTELVNDLKSARDREKRFYEEERAVSATARARRDAAVTLLRELQALEAKNDPDVLGGIAGKAVRDFKDRINAFLASEGKS